MKKKKPTAATLARSQAALRKFEQSVDLAFEHYSVRERAANDTYEKAKERALRKFEQSVDLAFERYSVRERAANDTYEKAKERAKARLDQITRELMEGKKS